MEMYNKNYVVVFTPQRNALRNKVYKDIYLFD